MKASAITVGLVFAMAAQSADAETIYCQGRGLRDVKITINAKKQFGKMLNCIDGDFISDMTPCAPEEGFGLSAPTAEAALVSIVSRWQDYAGHIGGVAGFFSTPTEYHFSGGTNSDVDGYDELWTFELSRISGKAVLKRKGAHPVSYSCRVAHRKL